MSYTMVNEQPMETGCYCEGSRGQYAIDHLAELADSILIDSDYAKMVAAVRFVESSYSGWIEMGEILNDLDEQIINALNDVTAGRFCWSWEDGEVFLMELPNDEDDPGDDNLPCIDCGRIDMPLHVDYRCPDCHPLNTDEGG